MKNGDIYVVHILDAIKRIKSYTAAKTYKDFEADSQLQDSVVRNLEIIGEAARRLSPEIKTKTDLPWTEISAMRNKIVHDYFELNMEIVWKAATEEILEIETALAPYNPER